MTFEVEVFPGGKWADRAAAHVAGVLPEQGVVIVTGGASARKLYPRLAVRTKSWSDIDVLFSDERCVPPDHPDSNYEMARATLLDEVGPKSVHRMRGEDEPSTAAAAYDREIRSALEQGPDLLLLGMGADCHIAGLFSHSPALDERDRLCVAIDRPDGMKGLTLTPPALLPARRVLVIVTGAAKAGAVTRALRGDETPATCPVCLLDDHPDATFLIDDEVAERL